MHEKLKKTSCLMRNENKVGGEINRYFLTLAINTHTLEIRNPPYFSYWNYVLVA